jgi:hypothetical protein
MTKPSRFRGIFLSATTRPDVSGSFRLAGRPYETGRPLGASFAAQSPELKSLKKTYPL